MQLFRRRHIFLRASVIVRQPNGSYYLVRMHYVCIYSLKLFFHTNLHDWPIMRIITKIVVNLFAKFPIIIFWLAHLSIQHRLHGEFRHLLKFLPINLLCSKLLHHILIVTVIMKHFLSDDLKIFRYNYILHT